MRPSPVVVPVSPVTSGWEGKTSANAIARRAAERSPSRSSVPSIRENLRSVRRHATHFAARVGFTYAVVARDTNEVVGCVYLYPAADGEHDCEVRSWVRAARADLDDPVHGTVLAWLAAEWPFTAVLSHPRR